MFFQTHHTAAGQTIWPLRKNSVSTLIRLCDSTKKIHMPVTGGISQTQQATCFGCTSLEGQRRRILDTADSPSDQSLTSRPWEGSLTPVREATTRAENCPETPGTSQAVLQGSGRSPGVSMQGRKPMPHLSPAPS